MKTLLLELRKGKRTGLLPLLPAVGLLGAGYAEAVFALRKDTLLSLPMAPMDLLLTQLYGLLMALNLFGIVVAACMSYRLEFKHSALKKMAVLPVRAPALYLSKFLLLSGLLAVAVGLENGALAEIGIRALPPGAFQGRALTAFAGYALLTSMPVLSFMVFTAFCFENPWIPLGVGVTGFLSGMALAASGAAPLMLHPFVVMMKPAVSMSARPDRAVGVISAAETLLFLGAGLFAAGQPRRD